MTVIFQITGYKNSGKTTVIEQLTSFGSNTGDIIAVIKHHPHEAPLNPLSENSDSERIFNSGASISTVISPKGAQLHTNGEIKLEQMIKWYESFSPDLILIEGYKQKNYPKAVILKEEKDKDLLKLCNIKLVLTWGPVPECDVPVIKIADLQNQMPAVYAAVTEEGKR
ncbi:molybdopterin-guanine dinucleotide biosynthesis protein B [Halobacillus massiliensis]|uniref:molybdopterin-guanine dinucleotide biosynthesis protein B n=1 Tax=Halobacillus massiliensis TaxID=1926286 RepID=UPI0009E31B87|nr:molybdopterin-guanine dinucleotide biosynthesis protein B [Halobacillus massiliensis]